MPWIAFVMLIFWCVLEAAIFSYTLMPTVTELLADVPGQLRVRGLELPPGLSELETMSSVRRLAARNRTYEDRFWFRGGGVYKRFIPTAVDAVRVRWGAPWSRCGTGASSSGCCSPSRRCSGILIRR